MKILLTGPTGFIGAAFVRLAIERGHSVAGLIIPTEQVPEHLPRDSRLQWLRGTLDDAPWEQIKSFKADVCVHTAWVTAPGVYLESPDNYKFLESSVRFLRQINDLETNHIVGLGTCVEYQINKQKLSENTTPLAPTTTYARCKNELRQTLETDAAARGFAFCWARVFYPYGPREHPSRLCSSIMGKLSRGEKITLKTPNSTKDYIFIEDLAEALLTVVERKFEGSINLGTGMGVTVREVAGEIGQMMKKPELVQELNPPETDPMGYVVADVSRLEGLGWKPKHSMKQGLEKLLKSNNSQIGDLTRPPARK